MRQALAFVALAPVALALAGCPQNDYALDGCSASAPPPVANYWAGPGVTDVTFLAFGDSQVFLDASLGQDDDGRKNDLHVQALNQASTLSWAPLGVSEDVSHIRGVIMAGDITQNGRDAREGTANEYGRFIENYGLCSNRRLSFPIFEGYGNHDYRDWYNLLYPSGEHPVADSVAVRNPYRVGLTGMAPDKQGHYTWKWDDVYFINTNLAPSDVVPDLPPETEPPGNRDPRMALTYLRDQLAQIGTSAPIVIWHHYGPWATFEWDQAQIDAYAEAIAGYHVIAILHGHDHGTSTYDWNGVPVFNVGSPYYLSYNPDGRGHYSVFRITGDKIRAFDVSWDPANPTSLQAPDNWQRVVDLS